MIASSSMLAPTASAAPAEGKSTRDRNVALDYVKGALVVLMVAYHCTNYFRHDKDMLKYLHFLPGSFIFITGFLATLVYRPRTLRGEPVYGRLLIRGAKLFTVFVVLNVAAHTAFEANYNRPLGLDFLLDHLDAFLLTGEPRVAVFDVLLPIAYLLVFSALLLRIGARIPWMYPAIGTAIVATSVALALNGKLVFNLDLFSVGVLGMLAGLVPLERVNAAARQIAFLVCAFAAYVAAVTYSYPTYTMNLVGVPLTLLLLYAVGLGLSKVRQSYRMVVLLGQYSLVAYIAQIAILQVFFRTIGRLRLAWTTLPLAFLVTLAATTAVVVVLDMLRRRSRAVTTVYSAIFA